MEHHTYAKSGLKIWTIEQKRSLVKKRINADYLFNKPSLRGDRPWKTFKEMAQIGDFSEHALRQQWQALVYAYRTEKEGISSPINDLVIKSLNKKWEFFGEIHRFMIKKNDHHSYAQKEPNERLVEPILRCPEATKVVAKAQSTAENNAENSSDDDGLEVITPEPYPAALKKMFEDDPWHPVPTTLEKVLIVDPREPHPKTPKKVYPKEQNDKKEADEIEENCPVLKRIESENYGKVTTHGHPIPKYRYVWVQYGGPVEDNQTENVNNSAQPKARKSHKRRAGKVLSEKDKYYRHRRRFEQRLEKRLKGFGKAVSVILNHVATNLGAQTEMPDLGTLFDSDSMPSSSSDSSADEDSEQN
ncbi:uncharacterized protein LOC117902280 [Drosophila subobscura]|uniref:uncharacterized protein LOC117902280 n=1 Tax=Drosophila subobscura TaxID=7241 RepID=UPI00155AE4B8|nr:uncharacterized protein LOC117902280 [Drosophila subobscura]